MATTKRALKLVQGPARTMTTWTPSLIRAVLGQAEGGSLRLLGDLCEELLADDRINGVFETLFGGLLGLPINFEASGDGRRKNKAVRHLEAEEDWWKLFPEEELGQFLKFGYLAGVSFAQFVYEDSNGQPLKNAGQRVVPRLEYWRVRDFRWDWRTRSWFVRDANNVETEIHAGDSRWLIFTPFGAFRPWASGLWRGLSIWWLLKHYAQDDAGYRSEKSGMGVITCGEDNTDEQRKELANDFATARGEAWISVPKGFDAKMLESREKIADNQGYIVDTANSAFAIQVLGQNLTTEVTSGSLGTGGAPVHARVENSRLKSVASRASTTLREQGLTWWAEFNYGNRELAPWPLWQTDPPEDKAQIVKVWGEFGTALQAFQAAGLRVDSMAMAEKIGLPLLKEASPDDVDPGSKEEREKKALELEAAKTPKEPDDQPDPPPDDEPESEEDASARRAFRLPPRVARPGTAPKAVAGWLEGQEYADKLTSNGAEHGAGKLDGFLSGLLKVINGLESLEDAEQLLLDYFDEAPLPEELAAMSEKLFTMSQLGGKTAVRQDVPELDDGS